MCHYHSHNGNSILFESLLHMHPLTHTHTHIYKYLACTNVLFEYLNAWNLKPMNELSGTKHEHILFLN